VARAKTRAAEWAKRVRAWKSSGKSAPEFAGARGWNFRTLRWWASRLRRQKAPQAGPSRGVEFVELVRAEPAGGGGRDTGGLEIVLANGRTVLVAVGVDLGLLRAVVETLEGR